MNDTRRPLPKARPLRLFLVVWLVAAASGAWATAVRADDANVPQHHSLLELLARETAYHVDSNERLQ